MWPEPRTTSETGRCESHLACAANQIEVAGACYPADRGLAALAQAFESLGERNDPDHGGTPEILPAVPAAGEVLVFLGNTGRPADFDGNGTLEQDRDTWAFAGRVGQYLRIRALSAGLPQPAFIVEGPGGYRRESAMGYVYEAQREVVLPRDGTYWVTITPAIHELAGIAIGGTQADYIGTIEELALARRHATRAGGRGAGRQHLQRCPVRARRQRRPARRPRANGCGRAREQSRRGRRSRRSWRSERMAG